MDTPQPIEIDLSAPSAAREVTKNELLQTPAYEKVSRLIQLQLEASANSEAASGRQSFPRRHNAISISGGRGTGKTTFMLSLQRILDEDPTSDNSKNWTKDIVWLNPIDPTLIETKENIVVTVLSEIIRHVQKQYRDCAPGSGEFGESEEKYKAYRASLKKLAEGLNVLEGIGGYSKSELDWDNPQYLMERGLERAKSGMNLEKCLHAFIDKSLALLKKKVFLLIFDDIDTKLDQGWIVLEVLRKYLTTPKLITLVLGDFHLYSLLVRKEQCKILGISYPIKDLAGSSIHDTVNHLESQYLQKILKIENRVDLKTIGSLVAAPTLLKIYVTRGKSSTTPTTTELTKLVDEICRMALDLTDQQDLSAMRELILRQPVRSIMHLLSAPAIDTMLRGDHGPNVDQSRAAVVDFIAQWSLDALHTYGIRIDEFHKAVGSDILHLACRFLTEANIWRDGYLLKPEFTEDRINLSILAIGSRLTLAIKSTPELLGGYFIRIGVTRDAALMNDAKTYLEFVGLTTQRALPTIACRAIGYIRSIGNGTADKVGPRLGSIALHTRIAADVMQKWTFVLENSRNDTPGRQPSVFERLPAETFYTPYQTEIAKISDSELLAVNTIRSLQARVETSTGLVGLPALQLTDAIGNTTAYLSIFPLIGVISELLAGGRDEVKNNMQWWGQVRSFPIYCEQQHLGKLVASRVSNERYREDGSVTLELRDRDTPGKPSQENKKNSDDLISYITAWVSWNETIKLTLPSHVLGDIWTRFYRDIEYVDETIVGEWYAGNLLHRYIVVFLNAILVEEHHARRYGDSLELLSPSSADWMFLSNLNYYKEAPHKYPWFDLFFSCPIWGAYLRPSPESPSGKSKKSENGEVWERQINSWHKLAFDQTNPSAPRPTEPLKVEVDKRKFCLKAKYLLNSKTKSKEKVPTFSNLYFIYNSLPVQGRLSEPPAKESSGTAKQEAS